MRALLPLAAVCLLGLALSGCAVTEVVGAGVGVATTVVSTTAHVAGSVVSGAADTVSGGDDEDKDGDSDRHHHKDGDDDGDK